MIKVSIIFLLALMLGLTIYNTYPTQTSLPGNITIDSLVVLKSNRQLLAFSGKHLIRTYKIALGGNPTGDKQFEGDRRTPEGLYFINDKNEKSSFHKNLGVSYPNLQDIQEANAIGQPPGGDIKIHGLKNGLGLLGKLHRLMDWTNGCVAVMNSEIDELFAHTPVGTPILIKK